MSDAAEREKALLADTIAAPGHHFTSWDGGWTAECVRELALAYGRAVRRTDQEAVRATWEAGGTLNDAASAIEALGKE